MRYEDASHTSAFQGSQPIANDDLDSVPAGSKTPATGNLITGEGTQTGSAGADVAPGAHVAAIAGKGGEDSSFSGGKLSVSGEHGKLSVDADGNYSYLADAGVENVRDRFTYTLADNNGATDTGALIVEIGKTPVVIKADAQQIVPGPDGVVTLPPGVELSDIRVVGRNLVIDMPDGTQLIIIDGAIFVPQLVLGGVEIPSTNLAALLIGQEPQPAGGEAPQLSSGGNFEVPVPPLDPGVPLGDLIPPTEYAYQPPEPQEVFDILDREPVDFALDILVDDDTFPGGLPGGIGDGPDAVNITGTFGTLNSLGGDGPLTFSLQLTGAPTGFAFVSGGPGVVLIQQNGTTVRTITFDPATGEYEVTQNAPIQHPAGGDENDIVIVLTVTVTDADGDTATGTVTITLDDDTPDANNDTDAVAKGATSTDGNVVTGEGTTSGAAGIDSPGADGAEVTGVHAGTSGSFTAVPDAGVTISGAFGDLTLNPDGSYTYTLHGEVGAGGNDVFTYQLTDGDGDPVTATLTINVPPDSIPIANDAVALVDDDGLPLGNHDSAPGDDTQNPDPDNDETTFGGTLTANFGTDGPGTFTFGSDMDGKVVTIGQEEVTYHVVGNLLTAEVSDGPRAGTDLFAVTLNANGTYTVQQLNNVLQIDDGTNTENNAIAAITFTAHDIDGDVDDGTLTITLDDDIPVAKPPIPPEEGGDPTPLVTGLVDEDDLPAGNNDSADGDDDPGNDDGDADGTTAGGGAGSLAGLFNAGADGPLTFSLSADTSGLPSLFSGGVPVTYAVVGNMLTASAGGSTVFTLTVNADGSWVFDLEGQLDHPTAGTEDNLSLDLSSVIVATDADGDDVPAADGVFVVTVDDDLPVGNDEGFVGGLVDEDDLPTGNDDVQVGDDDPGNADGDNDGTTTGGDIGSLAALFSVGADQPLQNFGLLTDTSGLPSLFSGGVPVTYLVSGDTLTASAGGSTVFTLTVNPDGSWVFDLEGQLDHDVADNENDKEIDFSSIITAEDADGDPAPAPAEGSFVVTVDDDLPVANDDSANQVGEDNPVTVDVLANDLEGADGVDDSDVSEVPGTLTGAGMLVYNGDGTFTYTPAAGETGDVTFDYQIVDGDGDPSVATVTIHLGEDSTPQVGTPQNLIVDEDGLAGANVDSAPLQSNPGETNSTENAIGSGQVIVSFGNDVPDPPLADSMELLDSPALDGQLVDLDGNPVTFALVGGQLVGSANGTNVIIISITGAVAGPGAGQVTYTYQAELLQPVQHADVGNNENTDLLSGVQFQVTDSDGDTSPPSQFNVTVVDDVPSLEDVGEGDGVTLDETDAGTPGGFPIFDTSATPVIDATQVFGADGPAAVNSAVYGLSIVGGSPEPSGLATAIGDFPITLVQVGNTIEGQYQDGGTQVAFTIEIDGSGFVTLTQIVPLEHLDDGNTPADFNDALDLSGLISATLTITDGDGDEASASVPIGDNLVFLDDGPNSEVNGQVNVPTLTLDETRPEGVDTDSGDGAPPGDASVTVGFASNFQAADHGADGPGTVSYQLVLEAEGTASGMYALDNSDTDDGGDGDGYGQGDEILLFSEPDGSITGRTTDGGSIYFTISVNASGQVTFTQNLNVWHADPADDDDSSGLSAAAETLQLQQTVTDADGDFDTALIDLSDGVFFIEDDGPEILEVTDAQGDNTGPIPTAEGIFDFDIGTDSPNGGNDDISIDPSTFNVSVNGNPIDPADVTFVEGPEDADSAEFTFSFDYDTGNGETATAEGTLFFDKAAGTYTVTLDNGPIEGFSIVSTATGGDPVFYNNEHIGIVDVSGDGTLFMQFTGFSSATGPSPFGNDDVFTGTDDNVHISSTEIGVHGNALQDSEVVDFEFMTSDPGPVDADPNATASTAFLVLGQFNSSNPEDVILVLKLADPNDPDNFITRTVVVSGLVSSGGDIIDDNGDVPAGFPALGTNQAMIIISPEDYINLPGVPDNYEIAGMQIRSSSEGLSSAAGEVYNFDGVIGEFDNTTTSFGADTNDNDVLKIVNIGAVIESTEDQSATINFDVTITDADGDSETTPISVTIGDPPADALAFSTMEASSEPANDTSSFSLLASDSQDQQVQKSAANSNTLTLAAAIAAAGVAETQAAAAPVDDDAGSKHHGSESSSQPGSRHTAANDSNDDASSALSNETQEAANDSAPVESSSHGSDPVESDHVLDDSSAKADAQSSDVPAANDQGPASSSVEASPAAQTVGMPSAEALQAAGVAGNAKHGDEVEQIVAEALGQGNAPATVDALLDAMGGGSGPAALANLASHGAGNVPAWDMAANGAFGHGADMMMKMGAEMLHHDAVQPAVNG